MITNLQYRFAGRFAIASGIAGTLAFGFLLAYLNTREQKFAEAIVFLRFHDALAVLQFLLLIPPVIALYHIVQKSTYRVERNTLTIGIGALVTSVFFLVLTIPRILSDVLYLFPQGVFGVWLVFISLRLKGLHPKGLIWLGIVVGTGLAISGIFPIGYAIFVDTIILRIPAASDEAVNKVATDTTANTILHNMVAIGLVGVVLFPIWTILTGVKLLREKINR